MTAQLTEKDEGVIAWSARVIEAAMELYKNRCSFYIDVVTGERHEVRTSNSGDTAYIIPPIYMDALKDAIEAKP